MHRVFCATPFECESEREAFYKAIADFNEAEAMPRGVLFVALSLVPRMVDKRPYQAAVDENIGSCRYYILLLTDGWGPDQRNLHRDFALARRCEDDPARPMRQVVLMRRATAADGGDDFGRQLAAEGLAPESFSSPAELEQRFRSLFTEWLGTAVAAGA
jgi:hypothetical protein